MQGKILSESDIILPTSNNASAYYFSFSGVLSLAGITMLQSTDVVTGCRHWRSLGDMAHQPIPNYIRVHREVDELQFRVPVQGSDE